LLQWPHPVYGPARAQQENPMTVATGIRVWDLPTRLFHWLLVALFAFSWYSAENGLMDWHRRSGLTLLALIAFRLIWGVIGGSTARFAHFVRGPGAIFRYLRGAPAGIGHNPLGGLSVIALLALLVVQIVAGLYAVDVDSLESGPLSDAVSFETGRQAAHIHHLCFNVLLALSALHIATILFYRLRGRNLVTPMLTGRDRQADAVTTPLVPSHPIAFVLAVAAAAALAWWIGQGAPH
jgi:cytochrome b